MNGTMESRRNESHSHGSHGTSKGPKNYKLLVDPALVKGASAKLYRYDGIVPNDASYRPPVPRDPRSHLTRIWTRLETLELPVPRSDLVLKQLGLFYYLIHPKYKHSTLQLKLAKIEVIKAVTVLETEIYVFLN
jgi:hypothetical protein